jgi:hypothetical protein
MGLFSKLFGSNGPEEVIAIDVEAKKRGLAELSTAIRTLTDRMQGDGFPVENPGWQGRIRDLQRARADADRLEQQSTFTRQDLFDYTTTVRPLYRGEAPPEFAGLAEENARVVSALDGLLG